MVDVLLRAAGACSLLTFITPLPPAVLAAYCLPLIRRLKEPTEGTASQHAALCSSRYVDFHHWHLHWCARSTWLSREKHDVSGSSSRWKSETVCSLKARMFAGIFLKVESTQVLSKVTFLQMQKKKKASEFQPLDKDHLKEVLQEWRNPVMGGCWFIFEWQALRDVLWGQLQTLLQCEGDTSSDWLSSTNDAGQRQDAVRVSHSLKGKWSGV